MCVGAAPPQAAAGLLDHQPHGRPPDRRRPADGQGRWPGPRSTRWRTGLIKAALFFCGGHPAQPLRLRGRGQARGAAAGDLRWVQALFVLAALGLAGLPPFGTSLGKSLVEEAGHELHLEWLPPLFLARRGADRRRRPAGGGARLLGLGPRRAGPVPVRGRGAGDAGDLHARALRHAPPRRPARRRVPRGRPLAGPAARRRRRRAALPGPAGVPVHRARPRPGGIGRLPGRAGPVGHPLEPGRGAGAPSASPPGRCSGRPPCAARAARSPARCWPRSAPCTAAQVGDYVTWIVVGTAVLGGLCAFTLR